MWDLDLYQRKPGAAYDKEGNRTGTTDLDMITFLFALRHRQAVINIPTYKGIRASSRKEGQQVLSKENRHGKITGLSSNNETFTFGAKIMDMNVINHQDGGSVGDFRAFSLTDLDGGWWEGWQRIEFSPTAKENDFLNDRRLWDGFTLTFENMVHPNRWISLYGKPYFITKALIARLEEEGKHLDKQIKRMLTVGITYPGGGTQQKTWPKSTKAESKAIKIEAFEVEIDMPDRSGEYPVHQDNQEQLVAATERRREIIFKELAALRFVTRGVEYAFYKRTKNRDGDEPFAAWITDAAWERDYTPPGKRTKWNRLILFQPQVGHHGVAIRTRTKQKTERVAMHYKEK